MAAPAATVTLLSVTVPNRRTGLKAVRPGRQPRQGVSTGGIGRLPSPTALPSLSFITTKWREALAIRIEHEARDGRGRCQREVYFGDERLR